MPEVLVPVAEVVAVVKAMVIVGACYGVAEWSAWCRRKERDTRQKEVTP